MTEFARTFIMMFRRILLGVVLFLGSITTAGLMTGDLTLPLIPEPNNPDRTAIVLWVVVIIVMMLVFAGHLEKKDD